MSNSPLVSYTKLSPCNSGKRTMAIDRITPHCVVGQLSVETIGACFDHSSAQASCNYGIGVDGRVMLCVPEDQRSWCSSSSANDQRAVTIECACDKTHPYAINDKVYNSLIELMTDICRRNSKNTLIWFGDKNKTLNYQPNANEMLLTVHRWFANKACPGDYIYSMLGKIASEVTKRLGGTYEEPKWYRVRKSWGDSGSQIGAYKDLKNAKDNCPYHYAVYDNDGKEVFRPSAPSIATMTAKDLNGMSEAAKIAMVAPIYQEVMQQTGMLASVGLAQFCLESYYGQTDLAQKGNNLHGMKCSLSGNTWANSVWDGKSKNGKYSPEEYNGVIHSVYSEFRAYPSMYKSVQDRAAYFIGAWLDAAKTKHRYPNINMYRNAAEQVKALKAGGYATDSGYVSKLVNLINRFNLTQYDQGIDSPVWNGAEPTYNMPGDNTPVQTSQPASTITSPQPQPSPQPTPSPIPQPTKKTVYRVQVGVFSKPKERDKLIKRINNAVGYECFYEEVGGQYYVYCGSFTNKSAANVRLNVLKSAGFNSFVKGVSV